MKLSRIFCLLLAFTLISCSTGEYSTTGTSGVVRQTSGKDNLAARHDDGDAIDVTFLQLNDVYEISPVENGQYGGMARVATVRKELLTENPNTFTVLSGDFISPSAIGTSTYQGKRINGAQMVDAMNAAGVDFVTFGNHEFDLGFDALQDRINQSKFMWISSNISYTPSEEGYVSPFHKMVNGVPEPFPRSYILSAGNAAGQEVRIGIIGLTIGSNIPPYVNWSDPVESARQFYDELKGKTDFVIAITHLPIDEDRKLAASVPDLRLILGGHEHTNMLYKIGETLISKADANARTVYIHRLRWTPSTKNLEVLSEVKTIDSSVPDDPRTAQVVREWMTRAYQGFRQRGFNPDEVITTTAEPLDGRESAIRFRQTNLGVLIAKAMLAASKKSRVAIFNSGSIRLDDEIAGVITQYDIIRTLPFGGRILDVNMKGSLLMRVLDAGEQNAGRGGYLQFAGVTFDSARKAWAIAGKTVDPDSDYWVIVSEYLFSGKEQGLEFFNKENPVVVSVNEPNPDDQHDVRRDIRLAVIAYLKK